MSKFVVVEGPLRGKTFEVTELASIGRGETCAVRLDGRQISRIHARLETREGAMFIKDNGSRNGIFVNGQPVKESPLRPDDQIEIGEHMLVFDPTSDPEKLPRAGATILDTVADPFGPGDWDGRLVGFPALAAQVAEGEDEKAVARVLLDALMNSISAERGFILISDADGNLRPAARKAPAGEEEFYLSNVVRHQLSRERRAVIATDVQRRQPHAGKTVGLLCAPLSGKSGFLGLAYLDAKMAEGETRPKFTPADLRIAAALAAFASTRLSQIRQNALKVRVGEKPLPELTQIFQRMCIAEALQTAKGDLVPAARQLGMGKDALEQKLKALGMLTAPEDPKAAPAPKAAPPPKPPDPPKPPPAQPGWKSVQT